MKFYNNEFSKLVQEAKTPIVSTALATPFKKGKIHLDSLVRLVQLQQKFADFVVALGTTAEPNMLSQEERKQVLATIRLYTTKPLVVGVSANGTIQAAAQAETAQKGGADGILISPPSFSKCTADGYVKHVLQIARSCTLPIVLYNAPSRCGYSVNNHILQVLAEKGVNFLKDAANDTLLTKSCKKDETMCFCGNDKLYGDFLNAGACGTVSVVSNVAPTIVKAYGIGTFKKSSISSDLSTARCKVTEIYNTLSELCTAEINPIAIKYFLYKAKIFDTYEMRLPLTQACRITRKKIDGFWAKFGQTITMLNSEVTL